MIILIDWPLANDHLDGLAPCKWSSWWTDLSQMINWNDWPLANDHLDRSVYCKWLTGWMISCKWSFRCILLQISSSFSFSVHLFLHRPKTQNSRILGQYTLNLLSLKTLSFSALLYIHKNMDWRSPNWVRHAKYTWSSYVNLRNFQLRYESSTLIPYKGLSSPTFQSHSIRP